MNDVDCFFPGTDNAALASFPAASRAGRLYRRTDGPRGLYLDTGTQWMPLVPWRNIQEFGAVGDGVTDCADALETALAAAPDGGVVYVPPGTFVLSRNVFVTRSNVTLEGAGFASILKAKAGFTNTSNKGLVCFGYSPAAGLTAVSNIVVRDLTLDGTSLAKALEFLNVTRGTVSHVQAKNAGPTHPIIHTDLTTDLLVEHCVVSGALGEFGDGIGAFGAIRPKIVCNTVSDVTRLGIVCEVDTIAGTTNSKDVLIQGNYVYNAHNATGAEHNGGIWLENTDGGQIIGNICENLHNTPGGQNSHGITASIGGAAGSQFQVIGNQVSGCQIGLHIQVAPTNNVQVSQFSMKRGTISNYAGGVQIVSGFNIHLSGLQFGENAYQAVSHGGVIVSSVSGINELSIVDSGVGSTGAMAYTDVTSADLRITSLGGPLSSLVLKNVQNWKVQMLASPDAVRIEGCHIKYDNSAVPCLAATTSLRVTSSQITGSGAGAYFLTCTAGALAVFNEVQFLAVQAEFIQSDSAGLQYLYFNQCKTYQCSFTFNGYFYVALDGCHCNEYSAGGALILNASNTTFHLRVRNTDFQHAADVAPINVSSFQPTTYTVMNVVRSSTSLGTLTPAAGSLTVTDVAP